MKKIIISSFLIVSIFSSFFGLNVFAADDFKKNNPDGGKYEFARSYISSLSYIYVINQRWDQNPPKKKFKGDDLQTIKGSMEYLVKDNLDLRIAKNYMIKYMESPNQLMRKVADMMIVVCDTDIALNNKQKNLWRDWLNIKALRKPKDEEEKAFIKAQRDVELKRKESDKSIVEASILMTKVLLSQDNPNDKGHVLALTKDQRTKLIGNLDSYGKKVIDWGMKPGQSTMHASIAAIREVLEDPIFVVR